MNATVQKPRLLFLKGCFAGIILAAIAASVASSTSVDPSSKVDLQAEGKGDREAETGVTIEMRYVPNVVGGNLSLISQYGEIENLSLAQVEVNQNAETGYYGVFTHQDRAYLTTCLRPQGKSVFTAQQLSDAANQNLKRRILPWLLGTADLRDWSCLWVNMSVSLEDLTQEEAYLLLQEQWRSRYQLWSETMDNEQ